MLEKKEKLKLEYDYYKNIQNILIVALFGIIAYVFNNSLSMLEAGAIIVAIYVLVFAIILVARKTTNIFKGD